MNEPINIPTPDAVMLAALYDDKLADSYINEFGIMELVYKYNGSPTRITTTSIRALSGGAILESSTIGVINRKLHMSGWHLEQYAKGYCWYLEVDKYIPPSARLNLWQRCQKALRILVGDEQ